MSVGVNVLNGAESDPDCDSEYDEGECVLLCDSVTVAVALRSRVSLSTLWLGVDDGDGSLVAVPVGDGVGGQLGDAVREGEWDRRVMD